METCKFCGCNPCICDEIEDYEAEMERRQYEHDVWADEHADDLRYVAE